MRNVLLAISVVLLVASAANAQELVTNGGFETGDFSAWTQWGGTNYSGVTSGGAHGGTFYGYFGPTTDGDIQQALTGAAGTYHVSFWYYGYSGGHMYADLGATRVFTENGSPAGSWTNIVGDFAAGANPVLTFTFYNPPSYYYLDDVSVTFVPEPASLLLLALGTLLRRR